MKLVIGTKEGKTYSKELSDTEKAAIIGKRIGDEVNGEDVGLPGYTLKLTGGSDDSGFPMRPDIEGTAKKKALLSSAPGFRAKRKGERRRKSVRGSTYSEAIVQVNCEVVKEGSTPLDQLAGKKEDE